MEKVKRFRRRNHWSAVVMGGDATGDVHASAARFGSSRFKE